MDVCYIVAYKRPECLYITLEIIAKNKEFKDLLYLFVLDYGFDKENLKVISEWVRQHKVNFKIFTIDKLIKGISKQPYCFFNGYKKAYELSQRYVFMIEEDVAISDRFFEWHYKIQEREDVFCSIATADSSKSFENPSYNTYYLADRYHSLGVCFKRENILKILKHANDEFYKNSFKYLQKHFPNSKQGRIHVEQAGVIWRVIENKYKVAFPTKGFGYHFGFYGKNRSSVGKPQFRNLKDKIYWLKTLIFNKQKMRKIVQEEKHYLDSVPVPLKVKWDGELKKIEI